VALAAPVILFVAPAVEVVQANVAQPIPVFCQPTLMHHPLYHFAADKT